MSPALRDSYACELVPAAWKHGERLKFSTGLLVRGEIMRTVSLTSSIAWLGDVLARFGVNLVGREVRPDAGLVLTAISVHSPAWPVDQDLPEDLDTSAVRLSANPDLWLTDVLWACLKHRPPAPAEPRIVGGDLNSSPTFDVRRPWAGNQETLDRMADLGFVECLRTSQGRPTPTFRAFEGLHQASDRSSLRYPGTGRAAHVLLRRLARARHRLLAQRSPAHRRAVPARTLGPERGNESCSVPARPPRLR